jgi:hypothetical protein
MFGFLSNDPLISLLRSFGYNVVRLPKANIKPLQLFGKKNNELYRLGELAVVFKSRGNAPLPSIMENASTANISGQRSGDLSAGLGLSMLGGVISSLGGSTSGLDSKYQQANSIAFQYEDVLEDSVDGAALDQFLSDADINPFSKTVDALLESDQVYVTTATIKSRKFTIFPKTAKGTDIALQIPPIQGVVGSNVKVSSQGQNSSAITFEGSTPLVFGFQAVQLFYDKGHYTRYEPAKLDVTMRGPSNRRGAKVIAQGPFINLGE